MLLVQPPIEDFYHTSIRTYPLSLLYLATALRDVCEVVVADFRTDRKARPLQNQHFPELSPYYRADRYTPFSLFQRYARYGAAPDEMRQRIAAEKPDVVAVSSLFSTYSEEALEVARCAKEVNQEIVTVMGGIHPTLFPGHTLQSPFVDYVVVGEGEGPLRALVEALSSGRRNSGISIEGVLARDGHGLVTPAVHTEPDIDLIPDRTLVDPATYRIGKKKYTFFLTSRGCPFHCSFCGKPPFPYRTRSMTSMEREITDCLSLGIDAIDFEDDMLTLDRKRFTEVLDLFRGSGLTLSAMNGIYSESLDEMTLNRMFQCGFRRLNFSLVDASRTVTGIQHRKYSDNFVRLLPYLDASDFLVETHFIIGLPGQSVEDILDTIVFLMGRRLLLGPSIFYLAPNSHAYKQLEEQKTNSPGEFSPAVPFKHMRSSAMVPVNSGLARATLYTLVKLVRFVNFAKSLLDRHDPPKRLSEITEAPFIANNSPAKKILATLLAERQFVWLDTARGDFVPEPHDQGLVNIFFDRAANKVIRGFKTMNEMTVD